MSLDFNAGGQAIGEGNRVRRGGSWNNDADNARSAYRSFWLPGYRHSIVGFRPVQVIP